jgi:methylmalonyl-CoA carboxyltransferase large subunit
VKSQTVDSPPVLAALEALREEVHRLSERVAALEAAAVRSQESGVRSQTSEAPQSEDISEEIVVAISAAIAAFLGKKPIIRQIRLLGAAAWAQQGRVTIQASHALSARQPRSPH